jgi:hypothetical protein
MGGKGGGAGDAQMNKMNTMRDQPQRQPLPGQQYQQLMPGATGPQNAEQAWQQHLAQAQLEPGANIEQLKQDFINRYNGRPQIGAPPPQQGQQMQIPQGMQGMFADFLRAQQMPQGQGGSGYQGSQNVSGMIDRRTPEIKAAQEAYRKANPQQPSPLAGLASLGGIYRGMK